MTTPNTSTDYMVAQFNATQAARDLIAGAQADAYKINTAGDDQHVDLDVMVEHRLEDLEQETMGDASRIGDEAWAFYHATKSEVERLQQFPEDTTAPEEASADETTSTQDGILDAIRVLSLRWMSVNDPNGVYEDAAMVEEGLSPMPVYEAIQVLAQQLEG